MRIINLCLVFLVYDDSMGLTLKGRGRQPEGVNGSQIKILLQEPFYVPSSNPKAKTLKEGDDNTNQQLRNDLLKVTNAAEKEWDQLDTRLPRYGQNRERTSG
jgi:hypothetical protein